MSDAPKRHYEHFAQRVQERCEYDVGDPFGFAAAIHRAAKEGDETRALRIREDFYREGTVIYRVFDREGWPVGYAVIAETNDFWPITFYNAAQYRTKRHAQKQARQRKYVPVRPFLGVDARRRSV